MKIDAVETPCQEDVRAELTAFRRSKLFYFIIITSIIIKRPSKILQKLLKEVSIL
jgi:hypothetical protein